MLKQQMEFDDTIKKIVKEFKTERGISSEIIRDDVMAILEKYCTVVYYPLEDESINGFHVTRTVKGSEKDFVYINTANTIERQNFTAAHELGHIWNAYSKAKSQMKDIDAYIKSVSTELPDEYVANKFAAELMMPLDRFRSEINRELTTSFNYNGSSISTSDLLRLTIKLMNTFFVGYKATTRRFLEIGRINEEVYEKIKVYEDSDYFKSLLKEGEYNRLGQRTRHKNITNLTEKLREAKEKDCDIDGTIDYLKTELAIKVEDFFEQNDEFDFKEV